MLFEHVICNNCGCPAKTHSLFTEKCSEILSSSQAFQHVQVLVSASPFNIKVNDWGLQAATPNPALHLTKAIIMRERL